MSPFEALGAVLILVNVWLVARRSMWNYAFGIAGVLLSGWVFYGAKLYSDMLLQGFFFVLQFYGWWEWSRSQATSGDVVVERLSRPTRLALAGGTLVAIWLWGSFMHHMTDAALPWWDAAVLVISVVAQILQSVRKVENWALWIVANILQIGLYTAKHLWIFTGLYVILLALALWGLTTWQRAGRAEALA